MSDCIDRETIMDFCDAVINRQGNEEDMNIVVESFKAFAEYVRAIPSKQPEPIRCKDCKNWDTTWTNDYAPNYHYCPMVDGTRGSDFYCADAERRTEG